MSNLRIKKKNINPDAIDGSKLKLLQNEAVRVVDAQGAEVELVKLDSAGNVLGNGHELAKKSDLMLEKTSRQTAVTQLNSRADELDSRLDVVEGDENTVGSVLKALKDAKSYSDDKLEAEKSARIAADDVLQDNIDNEIIARINGDQDEQSKRVAAISSEQSSRISADELEVSIRAAAVSSEQSARVSADDSLSERISVLQGNEDIDGSLLKIYKDAKTYTDLKVNIERTSRQTAVNDEADKRISGDSSLQAAINAEYANRVASIQTEASIRQREDQGTNDRITLIETSLASSIATEKNSRQSAMNTEIASRTSGDNSLDARLDVLEGDENTVGSVSKALKDAKQYTDDKALAADTNLINAINAEVTSRRAAVDGEAFLRTHGDTSLDARVDVLQGDENTEGSVLKSLKDAKAYADQKTNDERVRAINAETSLNSKIEFIKENTDPAKLDSLVEIVSAFQAADNNLNNAISNISVNITADLSAEATSRRAADASLASSISSETQSRVNAINTERSERISADAVLQQNINTEIAARQAAITAEASSRTSGDNSLDARVDVLQGDDSTVGSVAKALKDAKQYTDDKALAADTNLINAINVEVTSRQAAVSAETNARVAGDTSLDARVDVLQGDENTEGSVLKSLKDAKGYADFKVNEEKTRAIHAETSLNNKIEFIKENTNPSALDSLVEIVNAFQSADNNLNNAISNISVNITADLSAEVTSRRAADADLDQRLLVIEGDDNVVGSVKNAIVESYYYTDQQVNSEKIRAEGAELALSNSINIEKTERIAADDALSQRLLLLEGDYLTTGSIANMLAQAKQYTDDEIEKEEIARIADVNNEENARIQAINSEASIRKDADDQLASNLQTEINNRVSAVTTEAGSRTSAVNSLSSALSAEKTSRQNAVSTLRAALDDETVARISGDIELQSQIDSLTTDLQTAIETEVSARNQAIEDANLETQSQINDLDSALAAEVTSRQQAIAAEASSRQQAIADLVGTAPALLDTLKELADALDGDENFATTVANKFSAIESSLNIATQDSVVYTNTKVDEIIELISTTLVKQETVTVTAQNVADGYVALSGTNVIPRSFSVFIDRLHMFEGVDYSLTVQNGTTYLNFLNSFASGGTEAIEEGDTMRLTYWSLDPV